MRDNNFQEDKFIRHKLLRINWQFYPAKLFLKAWIYFLEISETKDEDKTNFSRGKNSLVFRKFIFFVQLKSVFKYFDFKQFWIHLDEECGIKRNAFEVKSVSLIIFSL